LAIESAGPSTVQLVFDTSVLVDAIAARGNYYSHTIKLLEMVKRGEVEGWYAAYSFMTVYHLVEKNLISPSDHPAEAAQEVRAAVNEVLSLLKPLPQVGDEFLALDPQPGDDLESLLIITLAGQYLPNPLIVTCNKWMLVTGRSWHAADPKEILESDLATRCLGQQGRQDFIDLRGQQRMIWPALSKHLHNVLRHGQYIMGPEVQQLEEKLAQYVGVTHCISASSGTDTLLIALLALGIGAGDEVITTPFTFIASGEMIALLGARPVFVDVDPRTYNIDPAKIEAAITPKTRAILPVSLYGQCADLDAINSIAARHGLPVIEDAAQSFGATYKGRKSCALSTIGSTSFFPSKPLGSYGDGGALFTNDDTLAKKMREIRVHGQDHRYHHPRIGINGRLDTLQAAIILAKLDRFDWEVQRRQEIGIRYTQLIRSLSTQKNHPEIIPPYIEPHNTSVYAQYTVQVGNREAVTKALSAAGIPTAVHYPVPLYRQPAFSFQTQEANHFPIVESLVRRVISLPMHPHLASHEQERIVSVLDCCTGL